MDNIFDLFFTEKEKEKGVKELFSSYMSDHKPIPELFNSIFGYDYSLFFDDNYLKNLFDLLRCYYKNDYYVRHSFVKNILKNDNATCFFELPIHDSRADIVKINRSSTVYEIKTNYDTLDRLEKQIKDYATSFEYIYIICPKIKVKIIEKKIPSYCGIYYYNEDSKRDKFYLHRKAILSRNIDFDIQATICKLPYYSNKNNSGCDTKVLNHYFKDFLNKRYRKDSNCLKSFVNAYL